MESLFDETIGLLSQLNAVRDQFEIRAELLPADLALVGLYSTLQDAAYSAVELCRLHAQSAAFPMARTTFEATQQIIALATEDDYLGVGTRAWLFHVRKERRIAQFARGDQAANNWYDQTTGEILRIWAPYNSNAEAILRREDAQLTAFQKNRGGADNFMGQNLGKIVQGRYQKLAVVFGKAATELYELNSGIYAALSRESHARLRLDVAGLRIAQDGTVAIVPQKIDEAGKNKLVLGCVSSSLTEARAALTYLIGARQKRLSEALAREAATLAEKPVPPGFKPDLGLHLMRGGGAFATFCFSNVPIQKVGILPVGTVSWSSNITLEDQEVYIASFDIPQHLVADLASALGVRSGAFAPSLDVRKHSLTQSRTLHVECTLGDIQNPSGDAFVPLSVIKLVADDVESGNKPN